MGCHQGNHLPCIINPYRHISSTANAVHIGASPWAECQGQERAQDTCPWCIQWQDSWTSEPAITTWGMCSGGALKVLWGTCPVVTVWRGHYCPHCIGRETGAQGVKFFARVTANEWQSWDLSPDLSDSKDSSVWSTFPMTPKACTEQENHLGIFFKIQVWGPRPCYPKKRRSGWHWAVSGGWWPRHFPSLSPWDPPALPWGMDRTCLRSGPGLSVCLARAPG